MSHHPTRLHQFTAESITSDFVHDLDPTASHDGILALWVK
jgi:hypothetical protein